MSDGRLLFAWKKKKAKTLKVFLFWQLGIKAEKPETLLF